MYKAVNNRIYITKGDSANLDFNLYDPRGQEVETDEKLIFVLSRNGTVYMKRQITDSIVFRPADTADMPNGEYKWRVIHEYNDGRDTDTVAFGELMLLE